MDVIKKLHSFVYSGGEGVANQGSLANTKVAIEKSIYNRNPKSIKILITLKN